VINTNLPGIFHRIQVMADYMSNFRQRQGGPVTLTPTYSGGDSLRISP